MARPRVSFSHSRYRVIVADAIRSGVGSQTMGGTSRTPAMLLARKSQPIRHAKVAVPVTDLAWLCGDVSLSPHGRDADVQYLVPAVRQERGGGYCFCAI